MTGREERVSGPPPELRHLVEPKASSGRRAAHGYGPHIVTPKRSSRLTSAVLVRAGLGSLGLALLLGVLSGRIAASERTTTAKEVPYELTISGAGHLDTGDAQALIANGGRLSATLSGAAAIRDRLLATGVAEEVIVERTLLGGELPKTLFPGRLQVGVTEKRAVAILPGNPPAALAGDGTVLGPASAADFRWAEAPDLPVVRLANPNTELPLDEAHPDFAGRTALAGRLAAALRSRPELDALVSELQVDAGPLRIGVVLRSSGFTMLLEEDDFLERFAFVAGLLPELNARWPSVRRIDARIPDRLLLGFDHPESIQPPSLSKQS